MSAERVIPARSAHRRRVESFPYFAADLTGQRLGAEVEDDDPVGAHLSTPEEDAARLLSVDQVIFNKLQEAERAAQDIARRAYEEGFASGEVEGRTFGESQYRVAIQRLEGHLRELSALGALVTQASMEETLALAATMAEYLAGQGLDAPKGGAMVLLRKLLDANPFPGTQANSAMVVVHLNPKDRESIGEESALQGIQVREDAGLSRGSVRLETPDGVLDASVERRRNRLLALLEGIREKGASR
jgi:flagellar biosynthesis/type III secretory pathway protein FliH